MPDPDILLLLKKTDIFNRLGETVVKELTANATRLHMEKGECLCRQGDPCDAMYLLLSGELEARIADAGGVARPVGIIGPGQPIGEIQILTGEDRTATVCALCDVELLRFSRHFIEEISDKHPEVPELLMRIVRRRLRRNHMAKALPGLFGPMDEAKFQKIESQGIWIHLRGGDYLFRQDDDSDSLYILVSGRMQAVVEGEAIDRVVGEISPGETVGEMAFFTSEPRSASILAVRDSELLQFPRPVFETILRDNPQVVMNIIQVTIKRLRDTFHQRAKRASVTNIAIVTAGPDVAVQSAARALCTALGKFGSALHLSSLLLEQRLGIQQITEAPKGSPKDIRLRTWLAEMEAKTDFVIYEADLEPTGWTRRCIRQADMILIAGRAGASATPGEVEATLLARDTSLTSAKKCLIILHSGPEIQPTNTAQWLGHRRVEKHFHIRENDMGDFARLARFISGNAVGVVLGGGGAKGLAHIGALRAITEAEVPVDMIGGTSMGAVIAAQYAFKVSMDAVFNDSRALFANTNPLSDYTIPVVSLVRGGKLDAHLQSYFDDTCIEDLPINFFCVSSNLSTASKKVHMEGLLWKAVRASISIPGVTSPVVDNGQLLVDGAVFDNLPGKQMREICEGRVIAIDVGASGKFAVGCDTYPSPWSILMGNLVPFMKKVSVPTIADIMMRTNFLGSIKESQSAKNDSDLYLQPPVEDFNVLEFKAFDQIVQIGYEYTAKRLEEVGLDGLFRHAQ
ncbi:MAG: cyclic nucleotide-binding domain-containing protein [Desulfobacterales bacterium]|nr:cyclic nucleotide-binding domain-containing protein [Desulfobacterales bacterium]